ncbi:unnamed protein product [Brassica rapa subsp. trilocularis]
MTSVIHDDAENFPLIVENTNSEEASRGYIYFRIHLTHSLLLQIIKTNNLLYSCCLRIRTHDQLEGKLGKNVNLSPQKSVESNQNKSSPWLSSNLPNQNILIGFPSHDTYLKQVNEAKVQALGRKVELQRKGPTLIKQLHLQVQTLKGSSDAHLYISGI